MNIFKISALGLLLIFGSACVCACSSHPASINSDLYDDGSETSEVDRIPTKKTDLPDAHIDLFSQGTWASKKADLDYDLSKYINFNGAENLTFDLTSDDSSVSFSEVLENHFTASFSSIGVKNICVKVNQSGVGLFSLSQTVEVFDTSSYQMANGGFESGNIDSWEITEGKEECFTISNESLYASQQYAKNTPSYMKDGNFFLSSQADKGLIGKIRSPHFKVIGTGFVSFRMGGDFNSESTVSLYHVNGLGEELVASFENYKYQAPYRSSGMTEYAYKVSDDLIGDTFFFEVKKGTASCELNVDSFRNMYLYAPEIDFCHIFPAGDKMNLTAILDIDTATVGIRNGGFEDGDLSYWHHDDYTYGSYSVSKLNSYLDFLNINPKCYYKKDGLYFLDGYGSDGNSYNGESYMGDVYSSAFIVGKTRWITFKMGAHNNDDLKIQLFKYDDGISDTLITQFTNYVFQDPYTGMGMTEYAYQIPEEYDGKTCYFKLVDRSQSGYGAICCDSFKTDYDSKPEIDQTSLYTAAYLSAPDGVFLPYRISDYTCDDIDLYNSLTGITETKTIELRIDKYINPNSNSGLVYSATVSGQGITASIKNNSLLDLTLTQSGVQKFVVTASKDGNPLCNFGGTINVIDSSSLIKKKMTVAMETANLKKEGTASYFDVPLEDYIDFSQLKSMPSLDISIGQQSYKLIGKTLRLYVEGSCLVKGTITLADYTRNIAVIPAYFVVYNQDNPVINEFGDANYDLFSGSVYSVDLSNYFPLPIYDDPSFQVTGLPDGTVYEVDGDTLGITFAKAADYSFSIILSGSNRNNATLQCNLKVTDSTSYHVVNGDFETGDLDGWTYTEGSDGYTIGNEVTYFSQYWPDNPCKMNEDGTYYLNGYSHEGWNGSLKSSAFIVGGNRWITFKMGGNKVPELALQLYSLNADGTSTLISQFNNWMYYNAYRSMGLTKYAYLIPDTYLGAKCYFVIVNKYTGTEPFKAINLDAIETYYEKDFKIDFTYIFPAGYCDEPFYDMGSLLGSDNAPDQLINGGFETGDFSGWYHPGLELNLVSISSQTDYFTQLFSNPPSYNKEGTYFMDGLNNNSNNVMLGSWFKGKAYSSCFKANHDGWISFLLGGGNYKGLEIRLYRYKAGQADELVASFTNYKFRSSDTGCTMYKYAYQINSSLIGDVFYFELFDSLNDDEGSFTGLIVDSFVTSYEMAPAIDGSNIYKAGYLTAPEN